MEPVRFLPALLPQQPNHRRRTILPSSTAVPPEEASNISYVEMAQGDAAIGISQQMLVGAQDPCHSFTNVNVDRQEFFSPGYPAELYPTHAECVLVLEANVVAHEQLLMKRIEMAQIKKQIEVLATFMPDEILKIPLSELNTVKNYVGVLLFADVSGFTPLCEKYNKTGKGGIYRLTATLNAYIGAIVEVLYFYGGDVLKFSGDAFLALWKVLPDDCLYEILHEVVVCALFIQNTLGTFDTEVNVSLKVKLAISCGNMTFSVIGDDINKHYVILGGAINDVKAAEHASVSGDIVISPGAWEHMLQERYEVTPASGNNVKVWKVFYKPNELEKKEKYELKQAEVQQLCELHIDHRTILHASKKFDDNSTDSKITEAFIRSLPARKEMKAASKQWIIEDLKPFIIGPVQNQVIESQPVEYLTEMREITIQFVNIIPTTFYEPVLVDLVDEAYKVICRIVGEVLGVVNKVSLFDKDIMVLILFGLRGNKHEMESQNALKSAYTIRKNLSKLKSAQSVSIGITNGFVYCGVVGHPMRREYTVIGGSVNKAARIMCAYPYKVTCDFKTYKHSKLSSYYFQLQSALKLKGIENAGNIFEYNEDFERVQNIEGYKAPMIGRDGEYNLIRSILFEPENVYGYIGICVHGKSKIGVSKVLRTVVAALQDKNVPLTTLELCGSSKIPYFCISKLYSQLYDQKAQLNSKELNSIKYLPRNLWELSDVSHNPSEDVSTRKYRLMKYFRDIVKFTESGRSIVVIDDIQNIDQQSWEIIEMTLPQKAMHLICGGHFEESTWDLLYKLSLNKHIKVLELEPIKSHHIPMLACQFLKSEGIPHKLCVMLTKAGDGRPGWIQSCLLRLVNNGAIELKLIKQLEADYVRFAFPYVTIHEKANQNRIIPIMKLNEKFHATGNTEELTLAAISLDLFDSFTPYQQLVIKTGSVLGEIFTRALIMVMLRYPPENVFASVIDHLFEEEVFDCGSRFVNASEITPNKICCRCFIDDDLITTHKYKFPKYAFCRVLHFKNKSIRDVAYNLLPANQRKELHLRITDVLENQTNKCPDCLRDNSAAMVVLRKFKEVMQQCNNFKTDIVEEIYDIPYPDMKGIIRQQLVEMSDISTEIRNSPDNIVASRKVWDPYNCYCIEILARVYQDLINHSEQSGHLGKRIFFTMQYGIILIMMFEYADAIQYLSEAAELCMTDAKQKNSQITTIFRRMHIGQIHQLLASCHLKLNQTNAAKNHLLISLRQYNIPLTSLSYKFCSKFLYRTLLTSFHNFKNSSVPANFLRIEMANCLSLVSAVFANDGYWNIAKLTSNHALYLLRTSNANAALLCQAYTNIIDIYNCSGDRHVCEKMQRSLGRGITRIFTTGNTHDLNTICDLLSVEIQFNFLNGNISEAIRLCYKCIELNNVLHAFYKNVLVMRTLSLLLLCYGRYQESVYISRLIFNIGVYTNNDSVVLMYYFCALSFYLESGFFYEPNENLLRFADDNFIQKKASYTPLQTCFIVCIYLYYVRVENLSEANKWKMKVQLSEVHCRQHLIAVAILKFLEGMLIEYVLNRRMKRTTVIQEEGRKINTIISQFERSIKHFPVYRPRFLILKAYQNKIDGKSPTKYLIQAKKMALHYHDKINYFKAMQCQNTWEGGYSFGKERIPLYYKLASTYGNIDLAQLLYPMPHE